MEKQGRLPDDLLEFIEDISESLLRCGDVVSRGEEVARVQPVSRPRAKRLWNGVENVSDLLGSLAHRLPGAGGILHEKSRARLDSLQRLRDRLADPFRRIGSIARPGRSRMKANRAHAKRARPFHLLAEASA